MRVDERKTDECVSEENEIFEQNCIVIIDYNDTIDLFDYRFLEKEARKMLTTEKIIQ